MEKKDQTLKASEITDKNIWEAFNTSFEHTAFFQSWFWGNILLANGRKIKRIGFFENNNLVAIAQVEFVRAKRGRFIHVRQGPVILHWNSITLKKVLEHLATIAKVEKASFIRISPLIEDSAFTAYLKKQSFVITPLRLQDGINRWVLSLTPSIPQILSEMRKTTRYMIKKSQTMQIEIKKSEKREDYSMFESLYKETVVTKHFVEQTLIKEEYESLLKEKKARLYFALLNEKTVAAAVIADYGNEAIYRHGATSLEGRKTPASYLLQWTAITDAKNRGCEVYDFWGIADTDNPNHPWHGLTLFKQGFGGKKISFIPPMDLPLSKTYWITYGIDYLTKLHKKY